MFVRQMLFSDVDRVYEIVCRSLEEGYLREVFLYFIGGWPSGQLVAVNEFGQVVGFLSGARLDQDKASVPLFAVDPAYRKKGVGTRLMEEFSLQVLMDGMQYIQLEVKDTNAGAIAFYKKAGFYPVAYLDGFYNGGGNAVRMVRSAQGNS
ncbi:MAG: GNAT family N-acetyltransferase [Candidatus Methanoplasma sp.]|jgi:ribosomal-protein-alanine N-acetyltransferase|nr:GNAT family N-acetyltransferase [Candidatus Methanoplasma sp.]